MIDKQKKYSAKHDMDLAIVETYALNMIYELDKALAAIGEVTNQLMELREWLFESKRDH